MKIANKKLFAIVIAAFMVFGVIGTAPVIASTAELTFTALDEKVDFSGLDSVEISKSYTIEVFAPVSDGYFVLLVPANKKTHYLSNELVTEEGVYSIPKKIGSDQIKAAYLMPMPVFTDESKVFNANVTNWYEYSDNDYLDTSVQFDFDEIDIADITKIKFTLFDEEGVCATRTSTGENLVTLLKDCAQYWDSDADNYLDVEGTRTMSCAFKTRAVEEDNGFWVSSAATFAPPQLPSKIVVDVYTENAIYQAEKAL